MRMCQDQATNLSTLWRSAKRLFCRASATWHWREKIFIRPRSLPGLVCDTKNQYFPKWVSWDPRETPKVITSSRGPVDFQPTIFEKSKKIDPQDADWLVSIYHCCWEGPKNLNNNTYRSWAPEAQSVTLRTPQNVSAWAEILALNSAR